MATATYQPGGLIAGTYPVGKRTVTITGGAFEEGTVLGRITASDKYTLSLTASADGSEVPAVILPVAVDASGGDVTGPVNDSGEFDASKLVYGAGHDADTVEASFRQTGKPIYLRKLA
ncbi:head decoration protein [Roseibium suaedae]|uniref:Bacteriophage lambda head decoration protein D n=1 Tax=Roseibium suaedae TaxID=735517 RepID=A0A1M7PMG8_9HYPH|nr:head decoration protein [Roseibium suaedae]SHN18268.1 Bacteriophage lambda head decoration protein D [Roseibium suaedae]